jgi:hypothetical protein
MCLNVIQNFSKILFILPITATLALSVLPTRAQSQGSPTASATLQKPPKVGEVVALPSGPMAEKAATACTECHEARIIVQQRLSKGAWTKEVDKMVKWGAVLDSSDRDALIDYLSSNFGVDKPPYEAVHTQASKGKK